MTSKFPSVALTFLLKPDACCAPPAGHLTGISNLAREKIPHQPQICSPPNGPLVFSVLGSGT